MKLSSLWYCQVIYETDATTNRGKESIKADQEKCRCALQNHRGLTFLLSTFYFVCWLFQPNNLLNEGDN